jgi:benzoyl-CoA reductase subunit D
VTAIGVDAGASRLKLVLVRDGAVVARGSAPCGLDLAGAAAGLLADVLARAGIERGGVEKILATGAGADAVPYATGKVNPVRALARAGVHLVPGARTVFEIGAEEARAVRCDAKGQVTDFALNDKCAAGAGSFLEAMSRALETPLEELGPLSLRATKAVTMTAQCVIFAESEVVSLIHRSTPREEIARAAYEAMANRVQSMLLRLGTVPEVVCVGGVARDLGFLAALERRIGTKVTVPPDPEFAGALGAALCAGAP